jgi:hypothetical protein
MLVTYLSLPYQIRLTYRAYCKPWTPTTRTTGGECIILTTLTLGYVTLVSMFRHV